MKIRLLFFPSLLVLVIFGLTIQFKGIRANPDRADVALRFIREIPDWMYFSLLAIFLVTTTYGFWLLTFGMKEWSRVATQGSRRNAQKVALSRWSVDNVQEINTILVARFHHLHFHWPFVLAVRSGHPDYERFLSLKEGWIVTFGALEEGMECALENELCGFLRIDTVTASK